MSVEATEETEETEETADPAVSADAPDSPGHAVAAEGAKAATDSESAKADAEEPGTAEEAEVSGAVELPDAVEPTELVGRAEPVERDEPGHHGRGLALAVLFAIAALAIVGGAIGTVGALTHGFKKPVTIKYRESAVFKLQTGDCVNTPNGQVVSVLPCSTPHQAEVFATFSLPGSPWPGTAAVRTDASSGCASRLSGYLNPQLAVSLAQSYVFPDQVAWTGGTRTVICEVQASSGQLTGSVRGASLPVL
jgi:hypothetical protein